MSTEENQKKETSSKVQDNGVENFRIRKAFWLSVYGLGLAALLVVILALKGWEKASDITAVVGLFTSVLGTLVGTFFGVQIGSADKAKAEERASNSEKRAEALSAAATPGVIEEAEKYYPKLFK